jgi:cation:H+ antiporter
VSSLLVVIGFVGLYLGGELLVRHASRLARSLGVAPLVVGLTVVAFGTSAPELAATLVAAIRGVPELAVANVIGSNIANIGLILGLTALAYPLVAGAAFARREVPWMIAVSLLALPLLFDGALMRVEAFGLLALLVLFLLAELRASSKEHAADAAAEAGADEGAPRGQALPSLAGSLLGVVVLAGAAQALVVGATDIATGLGISERVIGLTLVAVGTSLPELASSLVAAFRRETDIILGNIVGSNLFNLLAVLGTAGAIHPVTVDAAGVRLDLLIMIAFAVALPLLLLRGRRLGRSAGSLLLLAYAAYVGVLLV